jgi:hypothetical protein
MVTRLFVCVLTAAILLGTGACSSERLDVTGPGAGEACGKNTCSESEFCCNPSCGICAPQGGACTQQFCE